MDKKQRKANQKLQQAQSFAEKLQASQNLPLEEKARRTKVISPEIGKRLKFAILKENIYFSSYWALPTKRRNLPSLSGNITPFMRKGTLVSYEHIIDDECVFTDSNHNIIVGKCYQAKTVISETTLTPQL